MNTSKVRLALCVVTLSAVVPIWACASSENETEPDTSPDTGVPNDSSADISHDAGNLQDADCDGATDCNAYPSDCGESTLCAIDLGIDPSARLLGLWSAADDDIWTAGTMGLVLHYDGSTWNTIPTGLLASLRSVSGTAANDVWFSSTNRFLLHTQGITADGGVDWDVYDTSSEGDSKIMPTLWGSPEQGMWGAIDNDSPWNGGLVLRSWGWQQGVGPNWYADFQPSFYPTPYGTRALLGFGWDDLWSGWIRGKVFRRQYGVWQELNSNTLQTLNGIWGPSADDLWFVGTNGSVGHWDGEDMSMLEVDPSLHDVELLGVCGAGPNDVWIVGENAVVLHYNGQQLSRIPVGGLQGERPTLRKVWVSGTSDRIWIVGDGIVLGGKKGALQ